MKASDSWITSYASIYYFWLQYFVFIQTNYAQINGNGRFGINYPCRCSQPKSSLCTQMIPLATSCQSIDTWVFISLIIFVPITGIWQKPQEYQQLPPPVSRHQNLGSLSSEPLSNSLLRNCPETELCSQNLPQSQTLSQTRCPSRSIVELYQYKTRLTDVPQTRASSLKLLESQEFKKAENCWGFLHNIKSYGFLQLPL